jgi:pyruvate kinase
MPEPPPAKTKIVATIGPASQAPDVLERMIAAGMSVARINFAHGDFDSHAQTIAAVRAAVGKGGRRVAILADLPGPKLRIGRLAEPQIELAQGESITLAVGDEPGTTGRITTAFEGLPRVVGPGDTIFLNDGQIQLDVETVAGQEVRCVIRVGGPLLANTGMNIPDVDLGISAFTERDRECLAFALRHGVDVVSQSFVQNADDVLAVRQAAEGHGGAPLVFAKIERSRALADIDRILEAADGIMVARGDLGVEIPIERIAIAQKELIRKANLARKPVITATQMLLSMVEQRRPTRAEVTDVANAILDGTDCVMLSEESAIGRHPAEAVAMLTRIAQATEPHLVVRHGPEWQGPDPGAGENAAVVAASVAQITERLRPLGVFVPTETGATARRIAGYRLPAWITAVSRSARTCQGLQLTYGVRALHLPDPPAAWRDFARNHFQDQGIAAGRIIMVEGAVPGRAGGTNRLEIVELSSGDQASGGVQSAAPRSEHS